MSDDLVLSNASVATDRPGRYAKQLVAHLSRHSAGEWVEETGSGWIEFSEAKALLAAGDGALGLTVQTKSDLLARFEDVVGRHLVRFGSRDELVVTWHRADGTPGTEQRYAADE